MNREKLEKTEKVLLFSLGKCSVPAIMSDVVKMSAGMDANGFYAPLALDNLYEAGYAFSPSRHLWKITGCGRIHLEASRSLTVAVASDRETYQQAYYREVIKPLRDARREERLATRAEQILCATAPRIP